MPSRGASVAGGLFGAVYASVLSWPFAVFRVFWMFFPLMVLNVGQCIVWVFPFTGIRALRLVHRHYNDWVADTWLSYMLRCLWWTRQLHFSFYGENTREQTLRRKDNHPVVFLMSNHRSWMDTPILMALARRENSLGYCKFFAKAGVGRYPVLGWSMKFIGCIPLSRKWLSDKVKVLKSFSRYIRDYDEERIPVWFAAFLEGTRFNIDKYHAGLKYADKVNRAIDDGTAPETEVRIPKFTRCMVPRTKGISNTLLTFKERMDFVYDITIAYTGGSPGSVFGYLRLLQSANVHVHIRAIPVSSIDLSSHQTVRKWVFDRYLEKDKLLEYFEKHGAFPDPLGGEDPYPYLY